MPANVKNCDEIELKVKECFIKNKICEYPQFLSLISGDFYKPMVRLSYRIKRMNDADLVVFLDKYKQDKSVQVEYLTAILYDKNILYLKEGDLKCD